MNRTLVILVFFSCLVSFSQAKDEIYRLEAKNESPGVGSYIINVLSLEANGNYKINYQEYLTKKRKNKNLIHDLKKEYGSWKKKGDTLLLKNSKTGKSIKFLVKNKNKIALFMDNKGISPIDWLRVR